MKRLSILLIAVAAVFFTGCYPTRIVTVTPTPTATVTHSTTVSYPNRSVTTEVYSTSYDDYDPCLELDLEAVGAAFAQSANPREFETLLNNSTYMISNLDLNKDGYIDYLRVVETLDGFTHIFVIQAVLGANIYQDVATIVVENPSYASTYVEIIGAPFLYGQKYIVRPIYSTRPYIFSALCVRSYSPWASPWHWDNFPSYYHRPAPVHHSHYQAYIDTFMHNHRYCREVEYPSSYHYAKYDQMTKNIQRHDYSDKHPERSFSNRTAHIATGSNSAVQRASNARDVRRAQTGSSSSVSTDSRSAATSSNGASTRSASSSRSGSTAAPASTRSAGSSSTATGSTTTRSSGTSSASRSTGSSSSATRSTGSTTRSGSTGSSSSTTGAPTRSSSTAGSSATRSGSQSAIRSSSAQQQSSAGQTTVNSRVSNSGAARTKTTTTGPTGTTTTRSSSASSSSSSSRSSGSSSTTTRSSSSSTRSSGSGSATRTSSTSGSSSSRSSSTGTSTSTTRRR